MESFITMRVSLEKAAQADQIRCALNRRGIELSEFTPDAQTGDIHMFAVAFRYNTFGEFLDSYAQMVLHLAPYGGFHRGDVRQYCDTSVFLSAFDNLVMFKQANLKKPPKSYSNCSDGKERRVIANVKDIKTSS